MTFAESVSTDANDYKFRYVLSMMEYSEAEYGGVLHPYSEYLDEKLRESIGHDLAVSRECASEGLCTERADQHFKDASEGPPNAIGSRFTLTDAGRQALAAWRAEKSRAA